MVFYLTAAIYVVGSIVYIVMASGEIQEWAKEPDMDKDLELRITLDPEKGDDNNKTSEEVA